MKLITQMFIYTLLLSKLSAQLSEGKVSYLLAYGDNPSEQKVITMWFTESKFTYKFQKAENKVKQIFKKHQFKSIADSIEDDKLASMFAEGDEKAREIQSWYGEIGSPVIIYSTFDQNLKTYCIRDTTEFVEWQLQQDTMSIDNILCQKATGTYRNMEYVAWFAPSIPVSSAPLQFKGLPGLLIQETNITTHVKLSMFELDWPMTKKVPIEPCSMGPFISKREFDQINDEQSKKFMEIVNELRKEKKLIEKTLDH